MTRHMIIWSAVLSCFATTTTAAPALAQSQRATPENKDAELQRAKALHEQAVELYRQGKYDEAVENATQALKTREQLLGADHLDVAQTLNLQGVLHLARGEYERSEPLLQRVLAMREKALGKSHPDVAASLNNLGTLQWNRGKYDEAEPLYQRALAIWVETLGNEHPYIAASLNNLGILHEERGEYHDAEYLYGQALAIREKALGKDHPFVADSLNNLAELQRQRGEYDKAESLYQRALLIKERTLGKDHPLVATSLNNLAELQRERGEDEKAKALHRRALAIYQKTLGKDHPAVATSLNNLANLHQASGEYEEAESLYRRAWEIWEKVLGKDHPRMASVLNNLAHLYRVSGAYNEAELLHRRALWTEKRALGQHHPSVAVSLNNLAILHSARREIDTALDFYEQALHAWVHNIRLQLRTGSESQKQQRLAKLDHTAAPLSFHLHIASQSTRAATLAMNTILMHKGRTLDAMIDTMRAARERLDGQGRAKLDRLHHLHSELAHLFHQGPGADKPALDRYMQRRVTLEREIDALDAEIARQNPAYRTLANEVRIADVQAALPHGAALLELFVYRPYAFQARGIADAERLGEPRYAAYVVLHEGHVRGVDLGPVARIDAAARAFQESIAGHRPDFARHARTLDALVMTPIRPLLGNARHVYLAPDGQLSLVSFAALQDEQGEFLIERFSLTYLASGRDLVQKLPPLAPRSKPLIIADPMFDLAPSPMATTSSTTAATDRAARRSSAHPCEPISPLPGTRAEALALQRSLGDAVLWTQHQATETALSSVHGPSILHIATHAFFLPDQELARHAKAMATFSTETHGPRAPMDGMLRSGIMLAGAARCRDRGNATDARDDGVLTALEASSLDLRGTRLVVLSACETAMGEVKIGQGIYGLRRAFAVAGAETLVMSLWRVSDAGTEHLMRHYHQKLRQGYGRSQAMRAVQLDLIAQGGQRAHPFYWAPFIVSGDDSTLDGTPPRLPAQPGAVAGCAGCTSHDGAGSAWLLGAVALLALPRRRRMRS